MSSSSPPPASGSSGSSSNLPNGVHSSLVLTRSASMPVPLNVLPNCDPAHDEEEEEEEPDHEPYRHAVTASPRSQPTETVAVVSAVKSEYDDRIPTKQEHPSNALPSQPQPAPEQPPLPPKPSAVPNGNHTLSASTRSATQPSQSVPAPRRRSSPYPSRPFLSLWDYLREEVLATEFDTTQEIKWERVSNFMAVPFAVEKIMFFGMAVCLDSFLYTFTILPLRFCVAITRLCKNYSLRVTTPSAPHRYLSSSHKCDIMKLALIITSCVILTRITDASKMYHSVRGQDVVKLSVIFNVLEIADRLCCSLGQDLLDSLFSRTTLARRRMPDGSTRQPFLRPAAYFLLALAYVLAHTLVLLYQLVTLNVAINAFDNALLTLLLSNQFVEIKGSVFKKFEKENLFQLSCADIVERFQLGLMLFAIGTRNLIELSGGAPSPFSFAKSTSASVSAAVANAAGSSKSANILSPLPTSFTILPSLSLLETVLSPLLIVIASECLVDWLKHAFITKFNHFRPAVYGRFMDVLCSDLVVENATGSSSTLSGANPKMQRFSSSRTHLNASAGSKEGELNGLGVKREEDINGPASDFSTRSEPTSSVPFPPHEAASEKQPLPQQQTNTASTPSAVRRARKHTFVDQSPLVARRLGFAALPLACLIVRMTQQILSMLSGDESDIDECISPHLAAAARSSSEGLWPGFGGAIRNLWGWGLFFIGAGGGNRRVPDARDAQMMGTALLNGAAHLIGFTVVFVVPWAFLIAIKLLLGMNLAAYAAERHKTFSSREREEHLNAKNRPPIGMGSDELAYEARVSALLDEKRGGGSSKSAAGGGDLHAPGWNMRGEAILPPVDVRRSGVLTGSPGIGGAIVEGQWQGASAPASPGGGGGGGGAGGAGGGSNEANGVKSSGGGKKEGKGESLMDVSRYTMVRSRIW
ncbi:hypothetical protein OC846_003074 [Tilletia horrida]|uniref:DUF747-domain-containing protein n=1 Tax=Tilletia horrida TaxID=155126 RepID=A0AAN6JYA6_9BASI|nr:hypothetical protein OC845_002811 [Tilletia horrida]KAK0551990.1 hypothetical protein OC846_003074 [Tilletia horrida]KAK0566165.1 hypothetical protein OC861_003386 [Tilletia horrida]